MRRNNIEKNEGSLGWNQNANRGKKQIRTFQVYLLTSFSLRFLPIELKNQECENALLFMKKNSKTFEVETSTHFDFNFLTKFCRKSCKI